MCDDIFTIPVLLPELLALLARGPKLVLGPRRGSSTSFPPDSPPPFSFFPAFSSAVDHGEVDDVAVELLLLVVVDDDPPAVDLELVSEVFFFQPFTVACLSHS